MTKSKNNLIVLGMLILITSCGKPVLNGHYHLVWNKTGEQFQTWNIKNNRMKINEEVCDISDSCFTSKISFSRNMITIDPWVDIKYEARFEIDEKGIVKVFDNNDTFWLIPYDNCLTATKYFTNKTKHLTSKFNLSPETMTGKAKFPEKYENELIIGGSPNSPFYLFNDKVLNKTINGDYGIKITKGQNVWVHVDMNIAVAYVLPIVKELFDKGYQINYSVGQNTENNEQIKILNRTFKAFESSSKQFEIDYCEFCSKYPVDKIESVVKLKMLGVDLYIMNGDTLDLFHTRIALVNYLIKNKTTRISTQIQIEIDGLTPFSNYIVLIDELNWVHFEASSITFYNGKDDPDGQWIKLKQQKGKTNEILNEFPIRIKEIIRITAPNSGYIQAGGK